MNPFQSCWLANREAGLGGREAGSGSLVWPGRVAWRGGLAPEMAQIFSRDPVWSQTTKSGFRQQVFVMYHATRDVANVADILDQGFKISQGGAARNLALGDGLYVSRDIEKTLGYGDVCFKLLVYPGKTVLVEEQGDPMRTSWQGEYSSAWIPATCGWVRGAGVPGTREETCVKSSSQVRVLGAAYGHELLDPATQARLADLFGTGDTLGTRENQVLDAMLEELGIQYSTFVHQGSATMLEASGSRAGKSCNPGNPGFGNT